MFLGSPLHGSVTTQRQLAERRKNLFILQNIIFWICQQIQVCSSHCYLPGCISLSFVDDRRHLSLEHKSCIILRLYTFFHIPHGNTNRILYTVFLSHLTRVFYWHNQLVKPIFYV